MSDNPRERRRDTLMTPKNVTLNKLMPDFEPFWSVRGMLRSDTYLDRYTDDRH